MMIPIKDILKKQSQSLYAEYSNEDKSIYEQEFLSLFGLRHIDEIYNQKANIINSNLFLPKQYEQCPILVRQMLRISIWVKLDNKVTTYIVPISEHVNIDWNDLLQTCDFRHMIKLCMYIEEFISPRP